MNWSTGTDATEPARSTWYARASLDEYLAEAEVERLHLEATIVAANARRARAESSGGLKRTMAEMLLEAQRDVREIRRAAEDRARAILESTPDPTADEMPSTHVSDGPEPAPESPPTAGEPTNGSSTSDDEFFSYLRGALSEDPRLGPIAS